MRLLVIGGTGFIGRPLVRELARMGHEVAALTRNSAPIDMPAEMIVGERADLEALRPRADVVIDLILSSGAQARRLMETFRGAARRVVAASSMDVYRACGILHGSEEGPLQPTPLTEDSELRSKLQTYPPERVQALRSVFPWMDVEYDKIPVEHAILGDSHLPGTILRLPMIYGEGDRLRRFHAIVKRITDGRRRILMDAAWADWRAPRGYVENVAAAIALAAVSEEASGRVYNVAETPAFTEREWAGKIAAAARWRGEFVVLPTDRMPPHLIQKGNSTQDWDADSSRIRRELGYSELIPVEQAIARTVEWERATPMGEFNPHRFDYAAEDASI